jgi:hypothetical protein
MANNRIYQKSATPTTKLLSVTVPGNGRSFCLRQVREQKGTSISTAAKNRGVTPEAVIHMERKQQERGARPRLNSIVEHTLAFEAGLAVFAIVNGEYVQVAYVPENRGGKTGGRAKTARTAPVTTGTAPALAA